MSAITQFPKFTNVARAQLASAITAGATAVPLASGKGALFPALAAGEVFRGRFIKRVGATVTIEVFECTARTGDNLTVTRAIESIDGGAPTAYAFDAGDYVELVPTAETLDYLRDKALAAMPKAGGNFTGGIGEKRIDLAAGSAINVSTGNAFIKTISGATTFTVSNVPAAGTFCGFLLDITNGGSAAITWWSGVKWAAGTAPQLQTLGRDVLVFYTHDGGTTWTGSVYAKDAK